jgi:TolA-binding protein
VGVKLLDHEEMFECAITDEELVMLLGDRLDEPPEPVDNDDPPPQDEVEALKKQVKRLEERLQQMSNELEYLKCWEVLYQCERIDGRKNAPFRLDRRQTSTPSEELLFQALDDLDVYARNVFTEYKGGKHWA